MARRTATIGIDVGTSATKGVLVAEDGRVLASATSAYPLLTPQPGWTEQHPEDWWRAATDVLRQLTATPDVEVVAVGLSGQMHGSVFLDRDGRVLRPALLWNDARTGAECREIERRVGAERADRDHRQRGERRLPGAQDPVAARARARGLRRASARPAAQGLHPLPPHRRGRDRRLGRLGHAAPRPRRPPLQRRDPGRPRHSGGLAPGGARERRRDRPCQRRGARPRPACGPARRSSRAGATTPAPRSAPGSSRKGRAPSRSAPRARSSCAANARSSTRRAPSTPSATPPAAGT